MCVTSMVSDHYMQKWPNIPLPQYPITPIAPGVIFNPPNSPLPTPAEFQNYQELLRKAKLYDEMTNQPDCPDPEKKEWQAALEQFMRERYGLEPKELPSESLKNVDDEQVKLLEEVLNEEPPLTSSDCNCPCHSSFEHITHCSPCCDNPAE